MQDRKAPYIEQSDGSLSQIQLHHSRQNAKGPLFEVSTSTHRAKTTQGGEALHPYKTNRGRELNGNGSGPTLSQHPTYPVDRPSFDIDRNYYWENRIRLIDLE